MEAVLKLVKISDENVFFEDPEMAEKLITLIKQGLVTVIDEKFVLTKNGEIALEIGIIEFELLQEKDGLQPNLEEEQDKIILFFLKNWDKKRMIGLSVWIILIALWIFLRIF